MHHLARGRLSAQLTMFLSALVLLTACGGEEPASEPTQEEEAAPADQPAEPEPAVEPEEAAAPDQGADPGTTADTAAGDAATDATSFPVTVGAGEQQIEIESRPERIVSLSPTATEILFAVGSGDQVVAVDEQSDHPEDAPTTDLSGFQPNVEAIAGYEPDLVIASGDPGDLVASLEALGIPVLLHPSATTLEDAYRQIEQTGLATGHEAEASELVAEMQAEIDEIVGEVDQPEEPLTYYHELDPNYYTVTSSTFIGELYGLLGLTSIADPAEDENAGYPQLSPEFIIEADPDLIFLADGECCDVTPAEVTARPGWDTITAVEEWSVVTLDEDVASRWGPRVVEFLETVAEAVTELDTAA